jgi:hypothetical protein
LKADGSGHFTSKLILNRYSALNYSVLPKSPKGLKDFYSIFLKFLKLELALSCLPNSLLKVKTFLSVVFPIFISVHLVSLCIFLLKALSVNFLFNLFIIFLFIIQPLFITFVFILLKVFIFQHLHQMSYSF